MFQKMDTLKTTDFDSIRLRLASPEDVRSWSYGEVSKPETINYRTQKPEKDGLFCEKIFGPSKDWECYCGKYKKIRYKGIVCDKCGVEVTHSIVRRERMGHIELAAPVTHIWFLRGLPSKIGTVLEMSVQELEEDFVTVDRELKELKPLKVIAEATYHDWSLKYGHIFDADIGAGAVRSLLARLNLEATIKELETVLEKAVGAKRDRVMRRLKLLKALFKNDIRPEWMVLQVIPIIPPDLRPMVPLDGGRFATSDLNDLYRRVINRNNRLRRLRELNAPEVICRNEKRMLQEAVDALIDNGARHGKTVTAATGQKRQLKSLADMLKGKQGRFRQNLLGKRVDYSGRSVIVVGAHLKLHQCGLPKKMALELFKSFVIAKLIEREHVYNVRSANRFIESNRPEVWDILEEVTKDAHVLLNRAPTLHRLGIQAFQPVLIEGKAIQVHPLVCPAFNADFDGDQMAVHVPLSREAKEEAKNIMLSTHNLLKPATGEPIVTPSQDIVLGAYYLTFAKEKNEEKNLLAFASSDEAIFSYQIGRTHLQTTIKVKIDGQIVETSAGRIIFNQILPEDQQFLNEVVDKKGLKNIIAFCLHQHGRERTVQLLDDVKNLAIHYITSSGMSWGMDDVVVPPQKKEMIKKSEAEVDVVQQHYNMGLLTDEERRTKVIEIWTKTKDDIMKLCQKALDRNSPAYTMINSGARRSWGQTTQMMGMKGLVINPSGETIELPVKANFKEGV